MPDVSGWPTADECVKKAQSVVSDVIPGPVVEQALTILPAVIAEFQSPFSRDGQGGTGRRFTPDTVASSKFYDGNGFNRLQIDDIVPGSLVYVKSFGSTLTDVIPVPSEDDGSYHTLVRQPPTGALGYALITGNFPLGTMNIEVNAKWGFAAVVPADVCEAVCCEVAARLQILMIGMVGTGESIEIGDFSLNTAAGVTVWKESSSVGTMHQQFLDTIVRYRRRTARRTKTIFGRMS